MLAPSSATDRPQTGWSHPNQSTFIHVIPLPFGERKNEVTVWQGIHVAGFAIAGARPAKAEHRVSRSRSNPVLQAVPACLRAVRVSIKEIPFSK